jgi:heavy metal efflux system protein
MKPFIPGSASRLRALAVMIALDNDTEDCTSPTLYQFGSEAVKSFATVIIGGLISATLLTLTMLATLYSNFEKQRET